MTKLRHVAAATLVWAAACHSESELSRKEASSSSEHYVLHTVNRRPLPFIDSVAAVDERGRPLTEIRAATLDFFSPDSVRLTIHYRDLSLARTPCVELRKLRMKGSAGATADGDTAACEALSMDSTVSVMTYARAGEELSLTPGSTSTSARLLPGAVYATSWRGDTIRFNSELTTRDNTGRFLSRSLSLMFFKQSPGGAR